MQAICAKTLMAIALVCMLALVPPIAQAIDALPSWNDGAAKKSIVEFVEKVTKQDSQELVPIDRTHRRVRQ